MENASLVLEQVNKWYAGGVHAVKDINMEVQPGEFLVFVGPSGCGKSTTLRMIAGLERVDSGIISMGGAPVNHVPPKNRDIAMVFQNYALYPTMKVFDNIAFPLKMRHWKREEIRKRVTEIAESLDLTKYLQRRPCALSGGQRQKVYLAMALAQDTETILMDEPTTYLDVGCQLEVMALARRLAEEGRAVVMVLHDLTLALRCAHRAALLHEGRVRQLGTPEELYRGEALEQVMGVTLGRVETAEGWRYFYR